MVFVGTVNGLVVGTLVSTSSMSAAGGDTSAASAPLAPNQAQAAQQHQQQRHTPHLQRTGYEAVASELHAALVGLAHQVVAPRHAEGELDAGGHAPIRSTCHSVARRDLSGLSTASTGVGTRDWGAFEDAMIALVAHQRTSATETPSTGTDSSALDSAQPCDTGAALAPAAESNTSM